MVKMNSTIFGVESKENNIEDILKQICDLVNFDIGLVLMFDNNNKIARIIIPYVRHNIDTTTIRIIFNDKSYIDVIGKVDNVLKIASNMYCTFKYINLLESTRDKIFAQIFKRQRELKKI
ncbi:hypothetical protein [Clostridium sp. DJ247]|uniref:hypothetical protein n=1 Tax=Clostridium sp. DJ247 TaxID=2726188 RepID=UPI001629274C|nr:hypothetical protein [Clostridium sp. DJ247]MBC2580973.1 hypothetical protein [Clostridium sp. DJ247]